MKILLFGKNGQIGWELQRSLAPLGEVIALQKNSPSHCGDLSNLEGIAQTVADIAPDVIVNAAAYTAVDQAESESQHAHTINALAPGILAQAAKRCQAWLVHYSTDYVFDGHGDQPLSEIDPTQPLNIYGSTKLAGEKAIEDTGCQHLIFRTSWVYSTQGNNFAKTMLRLAQERDHLRVINDQIGSPTGADLLADITAIALRAAKNQKENVSGLYHATASGETSWYHYAQFVLHFARQAGIAIKVTPETLTPISTQAFPLPAKRPNNTRLNCQKLRDTFGLHLPHWEMGVARMLSEMTKNAQ
ncbi:MAG: dTDP-4-dehydrorhamnose reductase [Ottowia sp.]|nr:dTDP-4-dehydrorhamnose reductase [Ottowia sp.]